MRIGTIFLSHYLPGSGHEDVSVRTLDLQIYYLFYGATAWLTTMSNMFFITQPEWHTTAQSDTCTGGTYKAYLVIRAGDGPLASFMQWVISPAPHHFLPANQKTPLWTITSIRALLHAYTASWQTPPCPQKIQSHFTGNKTKYWFIFFFVLTNQSLWITSYSPCNTAQKFLMFIRHPNPISLHLMEKMWLPVGGCCNIWSAEPLFSVCQLID